MKQVFISIVVFVVGVIIPFVDYLVLIEIFYLLIPLIIVFGGYLTFLIAIFFIRRDKIRRVLYITSSIPIFIGAQFLSTFTVNKVQRFRSELFIKKIEKDSNIVRNDIEAPFGITFLAIDNHYKISYAKGFMVREVYDSVSKSWKSYGWND